MPTTLTETFIQERQWLKAVTPATVEWYKWSFKAFDGCGLEAPSAETVPALKKRIGDLLKDHKVISVNTYLRTVNAYLNWCHEEGHAPERYRLPKLKQPDIVIQPFTAEQVAALVRVGPTSWSLKRAQAIASTILDTGIRINEALHLRREDLNFNDLLVAVKAGKG